MTNFSVELAHILDRIDRPDDFCTVGRTPAFLPSLTVEGVGRIAFPLPSDQAGQIVSLADRAPFGRGEETVVDTRIRKVWQVGADRVRLEGDRWSETLKEIVSRVAVDLGVDGPVVADFYKLLLYDEGDFFLPHRDTEKSEGMFGTLIVLLPSAHQGGELWVRHRDREVRMSLSPEDPSEVAFAAFYADCVHEIRPVTAGYRLALVYNLRRAGKGRAPVPADYSREQTKVANLLEEWSRAKRLPDDASPEKLVYPLDHAYTPAGISFDALKGADAALAGLLTGAAAQADCELSLVLLTLEESGSAVYSGNGGGWGYDDEEEDDDDMDFEPHEVFDRRAVLSGWSSADGNRPGWGEIPFEAGELCPPDVFEDIEADDQSFREATGNEGASFDRSYHRGAFVLWPRSRRLAVLNQAGLRTTLPALESRVRTWEKSGDGQRSAVWTEADERARHLIRTWSRQRTLPFGDTNEPGDVTRVLDVLMRLGNPVRLEDFAEAALLVDPLQAGDLPGVVRALVRLDRRKSETLIGQIVSRNLKTPASVRAELLERLAGESRFDGLEAAAGSLVDEVFENAKSVESPVFIFRPKPDAVLVERLLTALVKIEPSLALRWSENVLGDRRVWKMDGVLVPAAIRLSGRGDIRDSPAVRALVTACADHLRERIARPLAPPSDWSRETKLSCRCVHCQDLATFLADPIRQSWSLKAVESVRAHVEEAIRRAGSDLDRSTDKTGRPYRLVCTKNQASYDRRVRQRDRDLSDLARLSP